MIIMDHTEVPEALRHRGYGEALMARAVDDMRVQGKKILPLCPAPPPTPQVSRMGRPAVLTRGGSVDRS